MKRQLLITTLTLSLLAGVATGLAPVTSITASAASADENGDDDGSLEYNPDDPPVDGGDVAGGDDEDPDGSTEEGYGIDDADEGPGEDEEYTEPDNNTKACRYAVQIYGIKTDEIVYDYNEETGEIRTGVGGLTFGPAIGASYVGNGAGKGHTASGNTTLGYAHRCIHNDSWAQIIAYNKIDPNIYEQCLTEGCTKSIVLTFTDENSGSYDEASPYVFNTADAVMTAGDGPGVLYDEIQPLARTWADDHGEDLNWDNSQIRAVLNGDLDHRHDDDNDYGGSAYTEDNSVLSAFPEELQEAIAERKVPYTVAYDSYEIDYTYDRLWLLSAEELYGTEALNQYAVYTNDDGDEVAIYAYTDEGSRYSRRTGSLVPEGEFYTDEDASGDEEGDSGDDEDVRDEASDTEAGDEDTPETYPDDPFGEDEDTFEYDPYAGSAYAALSADTGTEWVYWLRTRCAIGEYDYEEPEELGDDDDEFATDAGYSAVVSYYGLSYADTRGEESGIAPCFTLSYEGKEQPAPSSGEETASEEHTGGNGSVSLYNTDAETAQNLIDAAAEEATSASDMDAGAEADDGSGIAATGDDSRMMVYAGLAGASVLILVYWGFTHRRQFVALLLVAALALPLAAGEELQVRADTIESSASIEDGTDGEEEETVEDISSETKEETATEDTSSDSEEEQTTEDTSSNPEEEQLAEDTSTDSEEEEIMDELLLESVPEKEIPEEEVLTEEFETDEDGDLVWDPDLEVVGGEVNTDELEIQGMVDENAENPDLLDDEYGISLFANSVSNSNAVARNTNHFSYDALKAQIKDEYRKGALLGAYTAMARQLKEVSKGDRASTEFTYHFQQKKNFMRLYNQFKKSQSQFRELYPELIYYAMYEDMPNDFYWYGGQYTYSLNPKTCTFTIKFYVSACYSANGKYDKSFRVNTSKCKRAQEIMNNGRRIAHAADGLTREQALRYFFNRICELVSYDSDAKGKGKNYTCEAYNVIYVFDLDPSTNVVCQGYSKALKFLFDEWRACQKNRQEGADMRVLISSGVTVYDNENPAEHPSTHMWNTIWTPYTRYHADVTHCDGNGRSSPDKVFMTTPIGHRFTTNPKRTYSISFTIPYKGKTYTKHYYYAYYYRSGEKKGKPYFPMYAVYTEEQIGWPFVGIKWKTN